jgi:glycosyltransferase involved in cell wall biosynthesis
VTTTATISVVMPTYNRARFIDEALGSLSRQTVPPLEVIVVDDASTDDTAQRVMSHALAPRIRYRRQDRNRGASVGRNLGADLAKGQLIVFLDSDDLLEPGHHARALAVLERRPDVALYCCDSRLIGPGGEWLHDEASYSDIQCRLTGRSIGTGTRSLADIFALSTPFPGLTIRREVYLALGGLHQDAFPLDDYDLQLRVAGGGHGVYYEHAPLARYRVHGSNESGTARGVRVGEQKLHCLQSACRQYPSLRPSGRRRLGEVRRELAISLLKAGDVLRGCAALGRSLVEDPRGGARDLLRIVRRKLASEAA